MDCSNCANIFEPSDRALHLMRTFWEWEKDDVLRLLEDYRRVCDHLATAALDDNEFMEELERVSEVALPCDEAGEGKMLE